MQSAWLDRDAEAAVARYANVPRELALRVYTTRLLGADRKLVLHGGGNTSLKAKALDLNGDAVDVLHVKGSGSDMAEIEPAGLPAVRLAPLTRLRTRDTLSEEDFIRIPRANLIDPAAPAPSVELLLHAFMPAKFIDHTHATAILSLTDQPNGADLCGEVFGERLGLVPYVRPGFGLARKAADVFDQNPKVEGLILLKHGIFTFGADAREAYERMIEMVTRAEQRLARGRKVFAGAKLPRELARVADVAPILRGACSLKDETIEGAWTRFILAFRNSDAVLQFRQRRRASALRPGRRGDAGPHHPHQELAADRGGAGGRRARRRSGRTRRPRPRTSSAGTGAYFESNNARVGGGRKALDPLPRVVLVPGLGLFGLGLSAREARDRGRHRRSRDRHDHRRGSDRALRVDLAKPTCSTWSIGRPSRTSSARPRASRSPARSWRSPVRAAGSAPRPRARSRRPAPRSRCSTSSSTPRSSRRSRSAAPRFSATSPTRPRCRRRSTGSRRPSAGSTSWCRTRARRRRRARSARSTKP